MNSQVGKRSYPFLMKIDLPRLESMELGWAALSGKLDNTSLIMKGTIFGSNRFFRSSEAKIHAVAGF